MRVVEVPDKETSLSIMSNDAKVVLTCTGAMDLQNSEEFRDKLMEAADSTKDVVVDFRSVIYIDTAILTGLAKAAKKMRERGKRLKLLLSDKTHPQRTIEITGFSIMLDAIIEPKDEVAS